MSDKAFLGIDTSNYTTSAAIYQNGKIIQEKMLLPVKKGELGLRQSDAVFHHTKQLPLVLDKLLPCGIEKIGVSVSPTNQPNSYMPCFLVGKSAADMISKALSCKVSYFSHQQGHVAAALYSNDRLDLVNEKFMAFHLSGGTSEGFVVSDLLSGNTEIFTKTLDLNIGQAVDRVGLMLGLSFPAGKEIEKLALKYTGNIKVGTSLKGMDFSVSGIENKCMKLKDDGEDKEYIAAYVLEYIVKTVEKVLEKAVLEFGDLPIVFSGGVSSNSILRNRIKARFNAFFAEPEFSLDNASGVSVLASLKD